MCGRFVLFSSLDDIVKEFHVQQVQLDLQPRYNVAPTQPVAVVTQRKGNLWLEDMVWGLIPSWAKDRSIGAKLINARAETVHEKPSFRHAFRHQRCLVVADGFYEWQHGGGEKIPMFVRLKSQQVFGMAGLYEVWSDEQNNTVTSCTIITTDANDTVAPIHNRMPVILPEALRQAWLDPGYPDLDRLRSLLVPYTATPMEAYRVSKVVNSPANDSPDNIQPVGA